MSSEVALRLVLYAAAMLLFGASLFRLYSASEPRAVARMQSSAAIAALISGALWLVTHAAVMSGQAVSAQTLLITVRDTTFGRAGALRLALIVVFLLVGDSRARAALAAAIIASMAWSGHAVGTPGHLHVVADAFHLLAAGAWVGGLVPLAWVLAHETGVAVVAVTRRFSRLGYLCVAALVVTGLVNAWFLVASPRALVDTSYGRLLSVKLALLALMLGLASVNRWILAPRLPASAHRIAANAAIEAALGLAIVVIVAALGIMVPAAHMGGHVH